MAGPDPTVLIHLYRGELRRSDVWRSRLDNTTNWALTTVAAVSSIAFATPTASHVLLIIGGFLTWNFLLVEARRYRYYDLWIRRVRLLEDGFVAQVLREEAVDEDLLRELAEVIVRPRLYVSFWDAVGLRLRRTYAPMLLVLTVAWCVKIVVQPTLATSIEEAVVRAHIGFVPGEVVVTLAVIALLFAVTLYARSFVRPLPSGELAARRRQRPLGEVFRRAAPGSA